MVYLNTFTATPNDPLTFALEMPPVAMTGLQQVASFGLAAPLARRSVGWLYKSPLTHVRWPTGHQLGKLSLLSLFFGTILTGTDGWRGLPFSLRSHHPTVNEKLDHSDYLSLFLRRGLIGVGNKLKDDFDQPIINGLPSLGKSAVWLGDAVFTLAFIPAMAWTVGSLKEVPKLLPVGLLLGAITSLSSTHITVTLGDDPAQANALRQLVYFFQNFASTVGRSIGPLGTPYMPYWMGLAIPFAFNILVYSAVRYGLETPSQNLDKPFDNSNWSYKAD